MTNDEIKSKIEANKKVVIVSEIEYEGKKYIKTIKNSIKEIKYIYYKIEENNVLEVQDEQLLSYFKQKYECKPSNIIY